jgi:hypothetical protein
MPSTPAPFYFTAPLNPPPLHLLLVQTEIIVPSTTVLTQESIDLKCSDSVSASRPRITLAKPKTHPRVTFTAPPAAPAPTAARISTPVITDSTEAFNEEGEGDEDVDMDEEDVVVDVEEEEEDGVDDEDGLIGKPKGGYGRPRAGGYNLEKTVAKHGVSSREFRTIKVRRSYNSILLRPKLHRRSL